jgi:uroporphyrinogen-III decarboxylase
MNLSPALYEEFSVPYDSLLLERFDGGAVHFCGRGDHYIEALCKIPKLYGVNLSQPEYNDMETIYRNTVDRGIPIIGFNAARAEEDVGRENGFRHLMSIT